MKNHPNVGKHCADAFVLDPLEQGFQDKHEKGMYGPDIKHIVFPKRYQKPETSNETSSEKPRKPQT